MADTEAAPQVNYYIPATTATVGPESDFEANFVRQTMAEWLEAYAILLELDAAAATEVVTVSEVSEEKVEAEAASETAAEEVSEEAAAEESKEEAAESEEGAEKAAEEEAAPEAAAESEAAPEEAAPEVEAS